MHLLTELSKDKAKSLAYVFNNFKIRKIISIQRRKETINSTVEKLKDKIKRWRQFTRTTLDTSKPSNQVPLLGDTPRNIRQDSDSSDSEMERKEVKDDQSITASTITAQIYSHLVQDEVDEPKEKLEIDTGFELKTKKTQKQVAFEDDRYTQLPQVMERKNIIPKEEAELIHKKLAQELVKSKLGKLNFMSRQYLWW